MTLSDLHEPLLPIFVELARWAGWPVGARVLDAGCGPGLKADVLAEALGRCGTIIGVDRDVTLLQAAQLAVRAQAASPLSPVARLWLAGDIGALPLAAGSFDGVWCSAVLGLMDDQAAALGELRHALRLGGVAMVVTGAQCWAAVHRWPPEMAAALAAAYQRGLAGGQLTPAGSELGDQLAAQLCDAGFVGVTCRAMLSDPPASSPLLAELLLVPWAALRAALAGRESLRIGKPVRIAD